MVGFTFLYKPINSQDKAVQFKVYQVFNIPIWESIFRNIWPFGRTIFTILILILVILYNLRIGLIASFTFTAAVVVERAIKLLIKRERPFIQSAEVTMKQPKLPSDPSFPSGDTLRIWFLAVGITLALQAHWIIIIFAMIFATLVSLGRIAFGVHYPMDVLGGYGLGLLSSGVLIYLVESGFLPFI